LAAATAGGRVFIHSPHEAGAQGGSGGAGPPVRFLNINREVTALAAGRLLSDSPRDILLIGTSNSLQAYDVQENRDLFYREVPDAVTAITVGQWSAASAPVVFAGGNCSVQGFDATGQDVYWTVTGDVVTTLCMTDCDGDGRPELLVGSADFDIREYRGDDVACEVTETDRVVAVADVVPGRFAYALANGTVGVYNGATATRVWRVKSKSRVACLAAFDMDVDGVPEVVAGWASGKVEVRRHANGELVFRDYLPSAVAAIVVADYRMDGRPVLICAGVDGEVRAYSAATGDALAAHRVAAGISGGAGGDAGQPEVPVVAASNKGRAAAAPAVPAAAPGAADAVAVAALLDERAKLEAELRTAEMAALAAMEKKAPGAPASK
jgi:Bardet-Biedl syndrome 2 protein